MPDARDLDQDVPPDSPPGDGALALRVQRLEAAIAKLTESSVGFTPRLLSRESEVRQPLPDPLDPANEVKPIPRATPIPAAPTASLADFALPPAALPPPVPDAAFRPLRATLPLATQAFQRVLPPSSILRDIWWDLRTGYRMLRDPYYPMSLPAKLVPLFAVFYVCVWPWFSSWTGLIGTFLSGLVYIVVLYVAYKVIQRELRRYYDFSQRYRR
jgi:hypothetical protein